MNPARSTRSFLALERHAIGRGWRRWASLLAAAGALFAGGASAAEPPTDTATQVRATLARLEAHKEALARANAAVVGLQVVAVEDARSIATLGKERQGSGVLIGDDGMVLTIGYLILEADQVELVAGDGRRIPARVVAYDLASGFGLVQALAPLGIAPAPLGVSAAVASDEPLLFASGGDERDLTLARMVSRRPFSGYWEYHIEGALFTAPVRTDHSGAGLFNAERRAGRRRLAGGRQRLRRQRPGDARQHVRAGRPAEADPRRAEGARQLAQQQPRLARPQLRRGRRPGARRPPVRRQPGRSGGAAAQGRHRRDRRRARRRPGVDVPDALARRPARSRCRPRDPARRRRRCACRCMRSTA